MNRLILVGGESCTACKVVAEWLERNNVEFVYVDASNDFERSCELGVRSVPTLILHTTDGVEQNRFVGTLGAKTRKDVLDFMAGDE